MDKTSIPSNTKWALAFRTYLDPATATGPKLDEIVFPKVLKFTSSSSRQVHNNTIKKVNLNNDEYY